MLTQTGPHGLLRTNDIATLQRLSSKSVTDKRELGRFRGSFASDCPQGESSPTSQSGAESLAEKRGNGKKEGTQKMIIRGWLGQAALGVGVLIAASAAQAGPASAQLLFDWGGGNSVGASGREVVHFSPRYSSGQIVVSFGDRRLYYVTRPGEAISYPIAVPREQSRWQGVTSVSQKRENPSWTPTPTMMAENPRLPRWVPGGHPMNPLGVRALYLGSSMYRIHGTDAPWTIGTAVSKGCIRLYNQDVLDLYPRVSVGTKVTVTWDRFTTTASASSPPSQSGSGGSLFDLFSDDDDEPVSKGPSRRMSRSKARNASVE